MTKNNNFDLIRLLAALSVIISHSYELVGLGKGDFLSQNTNGSIFFSEIGVWSFFIISGYLIDKSITRSKSIKDFFWKRIIRIYPALIIAITITALLIGSLASDYSFKEYFLSNGFFRYFINISLFQVYYTLPGVFTSNPYPSVVNGSLWTLQYELLMYFLISFQFILKPKFSVLYSLSLLLFFFLFTCYKTDFSIPGVWMSFKQITFLGCFFFIGALINKLKIYLSINKVSILLITVFFILGLLFLNKLIFGFICLPLFIFRIAYFPLEFSKTLSKHGDFSYGIYIYAFPIQQLIVQYITTELSVVILTSMISSILIGACSWHFIEKPMMKYRDLMITEKKEVKYSTIKSIP